MLVPFFFHHLSFFSQRNQNMGTYESKAVHALMSVLICGQIPDQIKEEATIGWINIIMNAASEMVNFIILLMIHAGKIF